MKQVTAIFLICVFAFSQYAKQLSYMECKLANNFKSTAQQCDCEKKFETDSSAKKSTAPQPHFHPVIDEYFSTAQQYSITRIIQFLIEKKTFHFNSNLSEGNNLSPDRPPQI